MKNYLLMNDSKITKDEKGRYCLNDMRRASRVSVNKRPSKWFGLAKTSELITEIRKKVKFNGDLVVVKKGQATTLTYAHRRVAIEYAQWLYADFGDKFVVASMTPQEKAARQKAKATIEAQAVVAKPSNRKHLDHALIQTDEQGRVNLNVLFNRCLVGFDKYPTRWVMNELTSEYILGLMKEGRLQARPLDIVWEGLKSTTYADPLLAVEYAKWLDLYLSSKVAQCLCEQKVA